MKKKVLETPASDFILDVKKCEIAYFQSLSRTEDIPKLVMITVKQTLLIP